MAPTDRTKLLILATILVWIAYDIFTLERSGVETTISRVILGWHEGHPWVSFVAGVLVGHFFFPQPTPPKGLL